MADPVWINVTMAQFIHDDQIAAHGGAYGVLDDGLLESALARPQNLYVYEQAHEMRNEIGTVKPELRL
ncbi:MAG: hypothetical protein WCA07_10805 [Gloeobacterales cyanobacterium]